MSYGRTISFSGKVCPVEKLRSDLTRTTPIRFVVSSFQISGRYGWSKGRVYDGERHAQSASQRGKFQVETGDTHSPSSLLSISTVRVSPYCFSCRRDFFSVLLSSYFTSILSCTSARSPSFPRPSRWQLSYAPFCFGSSVFHLSRP